MDLKFALLSLAGFSVALTHDPSGFANLMAVRMVDVSFSVLPSTPENLKIASLLVPIFEFVPDWGHDFINGLFRIATDVVTLAAMIKAYKMAPFKLS